jgi:hypothetical protein
MRQVVLIDRGDGRFEPRAVRVGSQGNDWVEITEGVKAGDKVVTSANFLIDAESNLPFSQGLWRIAAGRKQTMMKPHRIVGATGCSQRR